MYLGPDDPHFLEEILREKSLRVSAEWEFPGPDPPRLHPQAQQWFVSHIFSPDSQIQRFLVNHETGTGKTLAALLTLNRFLHARKKLSALQLPAPRILVVGPEGSREAFREELLRYPEFGFISPEDLAQRQRLRVSGNPTAINEFDRYLRRRLTMTAADNGVQILGYQELANRLFRVVKKTGEAPVDLARIAANADSPEELDDALATLEKNKQLLIFSEFLRGLDHGLIIADEFHHTYNRQHPNTWGVAIRLLLSRVPTMRALYLSATPLGHPLEIVDLGNFLQTEHRLSRKAYFRRVEASIQEIDPTAEERESTQRRRRQRSSTVEEPTETPVRKEWVLRDGAPHKLGKILRGRVSFFRLADVRNFAQREYPRKARPLNDSRNAPPLNVISVQVPPQSVYAQTYKEALKGGKRIPPDGRSLLDMVFPTPPTKRGGATDKDDLEAPIEHIAEESMLESIAESAEPIAEAIGVMGGSTHVRGGGSTHVESGTVEGGKEILVGVYRTSQIREVIRTVSADWQRRSGVILSAGGPFAGDWLRLNRKQEPNLESYSPKYAALARDMRALLPSGKIFLYHPRVAASGVLQLAEIFRANGFIGLTDLPTADTLCALTGLTRAEHTKRARRDPSLPPYSPARMIVLTGTVPKPELRRLLDMWNSPDNLRGQKSVLLIASQVLTEGYTLRAVRHEVFATPPLDIAEFLQVLGRVFRYGVHSDLPVDQRTVTLHIYVNRGYLDERIYKSLMAQYEAISLLMRELHRGAADAALFHSRLFPDLSVYFGNARSSDEPDPYEIPDNYSALSKRYPEQKARQVFGPLFFWPAQTHVPKTVTRDHAHIRQIDLEEKHILEYRIRQALADQPVWHSDALWEHVREPLMDQGNFDLVLQDLTFDSSRPLAPPLDTNRTLVKLRGGYLAVLPFVSQALSSNTGPPPGCDICEDPFNGPGMGGHVLVAPEAYLQTRPAPARRELTLGELRTTVRASSLPEEIESARQQIVQGVERVANSPLQERVTLWADLAFEVDPRLHQQLIREGVQVVWESVKPGRSPQESQTKKLFPLYEFYKFFGFVLLANMLDKSAREVAHLPRDTWRAAPVGYIAGDTWWLYSPPHTGQPQGRWIEHPHLVTPPRDNAVAVGFRDQGVFKLRGPEMRTQATDLRKRERGMACTSYGVSRMESLTKRLRLALSDFPQARAALGTDDDTISDLCLGVRRALILAEARGGSRRWFTW